MLNFLLSGTLLGLVSGISPGPLFAMVISQTLQYGLREGAKLALSPLITDLPIVLASALVLSNLYGHKPLLGMISLAGGLFLLFMAWANLKTEGISQSFADRETNSLAKGVMINALSPHPYLFWITVGTPLLVAAYVQNSWYAGGFLVSFYAALVGAKLLLAVLVNRSRNLLQGRAYVYTMKFLGLVLFVFAIILFKDGIDFIRG